MKVLMIVFGLVAAVIYANGPPNLPTLSRMVITIVSFTETMNPSLCSNTEALKTVTNQVGLVTALTSQTPVGLRYWWKESGTEINRARCTGIFVVNNEPFKIGYTIDNSNNHISVAVQWL